MSSDFRAQLLALSGLMQLERRARQAETLAELFFVMVNETYSVIPYRQAVLWTEDRVVAAISGVPVADADAPFVRWCARFIAHMKDRKRPQTLSSEAQAANDREQWEKWLPPYGLWLPLTAPDATRLGGLLLLRDEPWAEAEATVLGPVIDAFAHAWWALSKGTFSALMRRLDLQKYRRPIPIAIALLLVALLFMPVRMSVLAPAEVSPHEPTVVRSPMEGVVDAIRVRPNQPVIKGQLLVSLDAVKIDNKIAMANKALAVAEAEYRQSAQQAVFDPKSKATLNTLQGRMEQHAAELDYLTDLRKRVDILAPRDGRALFDRVDDWIGRPVNMGERILTIADPNDCEIDISLPVADAIFPDTGAEVFLFLHTAPTDPIPARLIYAAFEAAPTPEGVLAYHLRAKFRDSADTPRLGLKGTAKIYGQKVSLFYYIMRRPLAALRELLGA